MNKNIIRYIVLCPLIFLYLQGFYIPYINMPVYSILLVLILILNFFINRKNLILTNIFKNKILLILFLLSAFIIVSGLYLVNTGVFSIGHYLYSILGVLILSNLAWFSYSYIITANYFNLKFVIKFLFIATYFLCIYGLLEFFLKTILHIGILDPIQSIICNRRYMVFDNYQLEAGRLYSTFEEPGFIGAYLSIHLPIFVKVINSKYKILKNAILNTIFKKTFIPIITLTVFCLKSPIWIFIFLIILIILYRKKLFNFIRKYIVIFILMLCLLIAYITNNNVNISQTYLKRIIITYETINDFKEFAKLEPSLATRIISYNARLTLFKEHPFVGVGFNNVERYAYKALKKSTLPLTDKIQRWYNYETSTTRKLNGAIFWNFLSETGLTGLILLYLLIYNNIKLLKKLLKCIDNSIEKTFISGLYTSHIIIIYLSIYGTRSNEPYIWFLLGLPVTILLIMKYNIYKNFITIERGNNEYKLK